MHLSNANWPSLNTIKLNINPIGDEGCQELCKAKWINLRSVDLYSCQIGNEGCEYLSRACWPKLRLLLLMNNNITVDGVRFLAKINYQEKIRIWYCPQYVSEQISKNNNISKCFGRHLTFS